MNGSCQYMSDPRYCAKGVGTRSQMCLCSKVLKGMPFLCDGVTLGIIDPPDHSNCGGLDFYGLALALGNNQLPCDFHGAASSQLQNFFVIVGQSIRDNGLNGIETSAIMDCEKRNARLRVALTAKPAFHSY